MWTISDSGMLINFDGVRAIGVEVSDDRQFVEVQVRWTSDGDRFAIVTLIVQDYGSVKAASDIAWQYIETIKEKLVSSGSLFSLPQIAPPPAADE